MKALLLLLFIPVVGMGQRIGITTAPGTFYFPSHSSPNYYYPTLKIKKNDSILYGSGGICSYCLGTKYDSVIYISSDNSTECDSLKKWIGFGKDVLRADSMFIKNAPPKMKDYYRTMYGVDSALLQKYQDRYKILKCKS